MPRWAALGCSILLYASPPFVKANLNWSASSPKSVICTFPRQIHRPRTKQWTPRSMFNLLIIIFVFCYC
jgi:hypothetical protein